MSEVGEKRGLYRPAILHQQVPSTGSRRALSQGYLVAQSSNPKDYIEDKEEKSARRSLFQPVDKNSNVVDKANQDEDDVSLFSDGEQDEKHQDVISIEGVMPSKDVMVSNITQRSKADPEVMKELLLDNSSDDANFSKQTRVALSNLMENSPAPKVGNSPVLIVDALGRTADPQATEVAVVTSVAKSSAKVVCHSPSETTSGDSQAVRVAAVPNVRVKIADRIAEEEKKITKHQHNVLGESDEDPVQGHVQAQINEIPARDMSELHLEESAGSDTAPLRKLSKKTEKAKPRYVASRYLSGLTTSKPTVTSIGTSRTKTEKKPLIARHNLPGTKATPKLADTGVTSKSFSRLGHKAVSSTPGTHQPVSKARTFKTPQSLSTKHSRSARTPVLSASKHKSTSSTLLKEKHEAKSTTLDPEAIADTQLAKKKESASVSQAELDLIYARTMQWIFAYHQLKYTFNMQEKEAMSQIYSMWNHVHQLTRKLSQLNLELQLAKHTSLLDDILDIQKSELAVIGDLLPRVRSDYNDLTKGLDAVSHVMRTKGILFAEDHDELVKALGESEILLGEVLSISRQHEANLSALSQSMSGLTNEAIKEDTELTSCDDLLGALSTLVTQESSLKVQAIEESRADHTDLADLTLQSIVD